MLNSMQWERIYRKRYDKMERDLGQEGTEYGRDWRTLKLTAPEHYYALSGVIARYKSALALETEHRATVNA